MSKGYLYDNGDELITREEIENPLPTVTADDNGKVLTVAEGEWSAEENPKIKMIDCEIGKIENTNNWGVRFVKGENEYYTIGDLYNMYNDGILLHCVNVATASKLISFVSTPYMKLNPSGETAEVNLGYILVFDTSNNKMLVLRCWDTGIRLTSDIYTVASNRISSFDLTAST